MSKNTDVCTVKEAAEISRVSQATIRRLIAAGKLKAARVGRSLRIKQSALNQMLSGGVQ